MEQEQKAELSIDEFVKVARAKGDVSSDLAAKSMWETMNASSRKTYVDQNRTVVNAQKTRLTQHALGNYKTKVDMLYETLSSLVLKNDKDEPVTAAQLVPHLSLAERVRYEALRAVDTVANALDRKTELSISYAESQRKNVTFRKIDSIIKDYQAAIDENAGELAKVRAKEYQLEEEKNRLLEQILKHGEEFESCEKYITAMKKQLDDARERQKKGEPVGRDINTCVTKDFEPTQKRYDELAGRIHHANIFFSYAKTNYESTRLSAHVLDKLDTRLRIDQSFLKDFRTRHTEILDIDIPLRGLELIRKYNGFGTGIAEFGAGQDAANVELVKFDISPTFSYSSERCEEISSALEHINGETKNSVREIIDRARREAYGI